MPAARTSRAPSSERTGQDLTRTECGDLEKWHIATWSKEIHTACGSTNVTVRYVAAWKYPNTQRIAPPYGPLSAEDTLEHSVSNILCPCSFLLWYWRVLVSDIAVRLEAVFFNSELEANCNYPDINNRHLAF